MQWRDLLVPAFIGAIMAAVVWLAVTLVGDDDLPEDEGETLHGNGTHV